MAGTRVSDKDMRDFVEVARITLKDDGSFNVRQIAAKTGLGRHTVTSRIRNVERGEYPGISFGETDVIAGPSDIQIAKLKDELRNTRKQLSDVTRNNLDAEAIQVILGKIADADPDPPNWTIAAPQAIQQKKEVPVTIWSDWHYGEVVSKDEVNGINEYNSAIAEDRIQSLLESTIDICRNHGPKQYDGMVINLLGDFISGGLHPELLRTDDHGQIPAAMYVR